MNISKINCAKFYSSKVKEEIVLGLGISKPLKYIIFILLALFSALFLIIFISQFLLEPLKTIIKGTDLVSYLTGGLMIREGQASQLYDLNTQLAFQRRIVESPEKIFLLPFRYPPIAALIFVPLTFFPLSVSYQLFNLLNLFLFCLFIYWSVRELPQLKNKLSIYLLFTTFIPLVMTIIYGQISIIILLIIYACYSFLKSKNYFYAGTVSGWLLLKPQFLVFLPFLIILAKDRRKLIFGLLISALALSLLSLLISGPAILIDYQKFLLQTELPEYGTRLGNMYSLVAILLLPLFKKVSFIEFLILNGTLYFIFLFYFYHKSWKRSFDFNFAVGILISIVFSVHLLCHDLILLSIPILILLNYLLVEKLPGRLQWGSCLVTILILFFLPWMEFTGGKVFAPFIFLAIGVFLMNLSTKNQSQLVNKVSQ